MKIGVLGGTFDPIHLGHIKLAEEARDKLALDKVLLIPSHIPPHKPGSAVAPPADRYAMAELAAKGRRGIEVSDIEIKLKGTSYSVNTVRALKEAYGGRTAIFFIAGADYADELDTWKEIGELKKMCRFVIAARPGCRRAPLPEGVGTLEADTPDISSTQIRRRIGRGAQIMGLVAPEVGHYIKEHRLYI